MQVRFSKNQKMLIGGACLLALLIQYFVVGSRELSRLVRQLEKGDSAQRIAAAQELGEIGSSRDFVVNALTEAIRDDESQVRYAAVQALVEIDSDAAVTALIDAFESRNPAVRIEAAEALERIGSRRARAALEDAQSQTEAHYQRTRLNGWEKEVLKEYARERRQRSRFRGAYAD